MWKRCFALPQNTRRAVPAEGFEPSKLGFRSPTKYEASSTARQATLYVLSVSLAYQMRGKRYPPLLKTWSACSLTVEPGPRIDKEK